MTKQTSYENLFLSNSKLLDNLKFGYAKKVYNRLSGRYSIHYIYKVKRGFKKCEPILKELIKLSKEEKEEFNTVE